jgi:hypothetical protein
MATRLIKDINRETLAVTDSKGNIQIITLKGGDMLEFRSKGRRFRYEVPLQACYHLALIYTAQQWYRGRLAKYIKDRRDGRRVKKPRPLSPIFNPKLYEALKVKINQ